MKYLIMLCLVMLSGCGNGEGDDGSLPAESVASDSSSSSELPTVSRKRRATKRECKKGGVVTYSGLDANSNGVLDRSDLNIVKTITCS